MGPAPLGGSCGRGKVPAPWEAPSPARSAGTEGELQSLKGECSSQSRRKTVQMVTVATWNTGLPVWAGQVLELRLQRPDLERGLRLAVQKQPGRRCWNLVWPQPRVYWGSPGHLRGQVSLFGGGTHRCSLFLCAQAHRGQDTTCTGSRVGYQPPPPPPLQTLAVVVNGLHSRCLLQGCIWAAATTKALGAGHQLLHLHTPCQGDTNSTCWGRTQQASTLKTALVPNTVNPHELDTDTPTCK